MGEARILLSASLWLERIGTATPTIGRGGPACSHAGLDFGPTRLARRTYGQLPPNIVGLTAATPRVTGRHQGVVQCSQNCPAQKGSVVGLSKGLPISRGRPRLGPCTSLPQIVLLDSTNAELAACRVGLLCSNNIKRDSQLRRGPATTHLLSGKPFTHATGRRPHDRGVQAAPGRKDNRDF